jgi:hypothetical protein
MYPAVPCNARAAYKRYIKWNGIKQSNIFSRGLYRNLITGLKFKPAKTKSASTQDDLTGFCFFVPLTTSENLSHILYLPLPFMVLILVTHLPCSVSHAFFLMFRIFHLISCIIKQYFQIILQCGNYFRKNVWKFVGPWRNRSGGVMCWRHELKRKPLRDETKLDMEKKIKFLGPFGYRTMFF